MQWLSSQSENLTRGGPWRRRQIIPSHQCISFWRSQFIAVGAIWNVWWTACWSLYLHKKLHNRFCQSVTWQWHVGDILYTPDINSFTRHQPQFRSRSSPNEISELLRPQILLCVQVLMDRDLSLSTKNASHHFVLMHFLRISSCIPIHQQCHPLTAILDISVCFKMVWIKDMIKEYVECGGLRTKCF